MSESNIENLPAIPHQAMAKLLETFKDEVFKRFDKLEKDLPTQIDNRIVAYNKTKWAERKEFLKYFSGGIPAGFVVWVLTSFFN